ncbi:hypothetical protein EDD91_0196 [Streptomyces sp. KS 21]|nr:hypothetical protein EDD91_0196 [Streptomyces sp. KS 21]
MEWWQAGLWGALGALLVEVADFVQVLQVKKKLPWKTRGGPPRHVYLWAAGLRTGMGFGLAVLLGTFGQVSGGFGAALVGMAAPKIIETLRSQASHPGRPLGEQPDGLPGPQGRDITAAPKPVEGTARDAS